MNWHDVPVTRRTILGTSAALAVAAGTTAALRLRHSDDLAETPLYSETVALLRDGTRTLVPAGRAATLVPNSRTPLGAPGRRALLDMEERWVSGGRPWTRTTDVWSPLLRAALLDLRVLSHELPCSVAGWSSAWRYAWPRDTAHVAVALALCGYVEQALDQLRFMQSVQLDDGSFEARYDIYSRRAPDQRPAQFDGAAWLLWAAAEVSRSAGTGAQAVHAVLEPMINRSCQLLSGSLNRRGLPPNTPDYWEVRTNGLTLGIAAPVWFGLLNGTDMLRQMGNDALATKTKTAADTLNSALSGRFGPEYTRELDKEHLDASMAFLCPPYTPTPPDDEVLSALTRAERAMSRPAGGLAPGAGWKADGVSWTPQTALFACVHAANGNAAKATQLLHWIDTHRTAAGSIPEKVLYDGRPAAVAPLAWTAALTVLTIAELRGARGPVRRQAH